MTTTAHANTVRQSGATRRRLLEKRYRSERRFRRYGLGAVILSGLILLTLLSSIAYQSLPAFSQTYVGLDVHFNPADIDPEGSGDPAVLEAGNYRGLAKKAVYKLFPDVTSRRDKRQLGKLVSIAAPEELKSFILQNPDAVGTTQTVWVTSSDDFDLLLKGKIRRDVMEEDRVLSDKEIIWIDTLVDQGRVDRRFAANLFNSGDSREPELAGVKGAFIGTLLTMLVTFLASFPVGVMAATYLEELAPKNRFTDIIEVNINNLAAVPSIVYGLLGLAVFINFLHLPRSAPLVGGLVLALMTLPVIIISTRAALASIPPSIREAALGVGASRLQVVSHHVLPLAMPGILTGTIIGLARAAGETAPLLMIGMMAFIVDTPQSMSDKATVLPAQIYMWANNPERAFEARTSAGIIILLIFLLLMNAAAIYLRKKYEKRW
ncbi:MAG: phosphate ABC transporter permease PstA [Parvibaculales bacterium]